MEFRTIDGSGNAAADDGLNAAGDALVRLTQGRYGDNEGLVDGPNPRTISNIVVGEGTAAAPNTQGLSGMLYAWGQLVDHDLVRTRSDGVTRIDVPIPVGDPVFNDGSVILMTRIETDPTTGTPLNRTTGWLDASVVYGADAATAAALRLPDGRMATSPGDNLPIFGGAFLAGDPRAAENPSLTALQTLLVREHNWQVARLAATDLTLSGDALYEQGRAIVGAEIARITYDEFLPKLLGKPLPEWQGYAAGTDARLSVEFTGAAWRWGHSAVSAETERKDETGGVEGEGYDLRDVFFMPPSDFAAGSGADGFLRHLCTDLSQAMDARIVEDLRNFLADPPVAMDLAAINIQRGRDLGLPTLNEMRAVKGLVPYADFEAITTDAATVTALREAFGTVDRVDLWTGGLSESPADAGAFLGETFSRIITDQFFRLRDGDRLWWENQSFDDATRDLIERTSLSDLIRRHTDTQFLQPDAFTFFERRDALTEPEHLDRPQLVIGTGAAQVLTGGMQDDLLAGRAGAQTLKGFEGSDTLSGGNGNDSLDGGLGVDRLRGGVGADVFRFTSFAEIPRGERIVDFTPGEDVIDLAAVGISIVWIGTASFSAMGVAEARLVVRPSRSLLQLDSDGDGRSEATIILRGGVAPTEADLWL